MKKVFGLAGVAMMGWMLISVSPVLGSLVIQNSDISNGHYVYTLSYNDMADSTKFNNDVYSQNKVQVFQEGTNQPRYIAIQNLTFNDDSLIYKFDFTTTNYRPTQLSLGSIDLFAGTDGMQTIDTISYSTDGTNWTTLVSHTHSGNAEGYWTTPQTVTLSQPDVVYYKWTVVSTNSWPADRMDQGWRQWNRCNPGDPGFVADFTVPEPMTIGLVLMGSLLGLRRRFTK